MKNDIYNLISSLSGNSKLLILIIFDISIIFITFTFSYFLYLDVLFTFSLKNIIFLFSASLLSIPIFSYFGLYKSLIQYIDFESVWDILKAVTSYLLVISFAIYFSNFFDISKRVLFINYLIILLSIIYSRFFAKKFIYSFLNDSKKNIQNIKNLLIYGANNFGNDIYNNLKKNQNYNFLGFVDSSSNNVGRYINKHYIYDIASIQKELDNFIIDQIIVPEDIEDSIIEKIYQFSSTKKSKVFIIPSINNIINKNLKLNQLKELNIETLLSRKVVKPIKELIDQNIENKTLLISGAGGSIGSELSSIISNNNPKKIILLDKSEFNLYKVFNELIAKHPKLLIVPVLCSVQDNNDFENIFKQNKIDVFFHAAAYKHVDLVEKNFFYSLKNNILGTINAMKLSIKYEVKNFVLISTDKAVRPTNYMGASKRFAELMLIHFSKYYKIKHVTNFCAVRFGNVIGSSGSVIPLFERQINHGGPVTVTDKRIQRYFMTINEAAELVIQASSLSRSGDIFVLDMGKPVLIDDIAKKMINLKGYNLVSNKKSDSDIEIKYTGLRPGEKLYEELFINNNNKKTNHPKIFNANENYLKIDDKFIDIIDKIENYLNDYKKENIISILNNYIEDFKR